VRKKKKKGGSSSSMGKRGKDSEDG